MRLSEILHRAGLTAPTCAIDPEIMDITADSRAVVPGMIFAALPGVAQDGARFIRKLGTGRRRPAAAGECRSSGWRRNALHYGPVPPP